MSNNIPVVNVFVRRSTNPRGSNHTSGFVWPNVGDATEPIDGFKLYGYDCGPGYYGYRLDSYRFHQWQGEHWLAFEATDGASYRDHGDKIAVSQARTLAHGDAGLIVAYLKGRGLTIPRVLSDAHAEAIEKALIPRDATAPRSGLGAIAYAIAIAAFCHPRVKGRHDGVRKITGGSYGPDTIAIGHPDWRMLDPDTARQWNNWRDIGGEAVCPFADYDYNMRQRWESGVVCPLPVYAYKRLPSGVYATRARDSVCAVTIDGKIVGWSRKMLNSRNHVAGADTGKIRASEHKAAEKARKAAEKARTKTRKVADRMAKAVYAAEKSRREVYAKTFAKLGVSVALRCTGTSWGRKSYTWDLMIGEHKIKGAFSTEPNNKETLDRVNRYLATGRDW